MQPVYEHSHNRADMSPIYALLRSQLWARRVLATVTIRKTLGLVARSLFSVAWEYRLRKGRDPGV